MIFFAVIILMVFTFAATIIGFIAELLAYLLTGRKNIEILKLWWIIITGGIFTFGAIYLLSVL
jgi:hypothetical protein